MRAVTPEQAAELVESGTEFKELVAILTAELYRAAHEPVIDDEQEKQEHDV